MGRAIAVIQLFDLASRLEIGSGYAGGWGKIDSGLATVYSGSVSHAAGAFPVSDKTFFDLSSMTKIVATTSLVMVLTEAGILDVEAPLEKYLPEESKQHPHLKKITLKQLLSHTSGLPWWSDYYEKLKLKFGSNLPFVSIPLRKDYFYSLVLATPPVSLPGEKMVYSDVGFSILGYLLEKMFFPKTLGVLVRDKVWAPLSLPGIHPLTFHYRPVMCDAAGAVDSPIAATEICPWRGWLQGQVHDDNAWSMGGVAAHSGVFGTLSDVIRWTQGLMNGELVSHQTLRQFFAEVDARRTLGFDMPSADGTGSTANAFSLNSIGHLGFTGTSLWIDLDTGDYACLLTNRVHPSRNDQRIKNLRRNFHNLVRL